MGVSQKAREARIRKKKVGETGFSDQIVLKRVRPLVADDGCQRVLMNGNVSNDVWSSPAPPSAAPPILTPPALTPGSAVTNGRGSARRGFRNCGIGRTTQQAGDQTAPPDRKAPRPSASRGGVGDPRPQASPRFHAARDCPVWQRIPSRLRRSDRPCGYAGKYSVRLVMPPKLRSAAGRSRKYRRKDDSGHAPPHRHWCPWSR